MTEVNTVLFPVIAAVLAGVGWNIIGIWQKWKQNVESKIQWDKVKKNVIIGAGLGIVAGLYGIVQGDAIAIETVKGFVLAIAAYFPLIVIVDKLLAKHGK